MTTVLIINKDGEFEETNVPIDKLYTVCDYKTNKDFELLNKYEMYEIYGKRKGKIGSENSYFIDETYYGKICIVKKGEDITINEWCQYYDKIRKSEINENELTYESYESE
jgi:hypothetical protein